LAVVRDSVLLQNIVGILHIKRVYDRYQLVLVVDLHGCVDINIALAEVLIEEVGSNRPLRRSYSRGYYLKEGFVLRGVLDVGLCCN
jgi:hypothetical protein